MRREGKTRETCLQAVSNFLSNDVSRETPCYVKGVQQGCPLHIWVDVAFFVGDFLILEVWRKLMVLICNVNLFSSLSSLSLGINKFVSKRFRDIV